MKKYFGMNHIICMAILFLFIVNTAFGYEPPDQSKTFYGDANGDANLMADDVGVFSSFLLSSSNWASFDTPQPDNADQAWNTCDISGDGMCQADDVNVLKQITYGFYNSYSFSDGWFLSGVGFPAASTVGNTYPFQINVNASNLGAYSGRPGVVVMVTVDSSSPVQDVTIGGRPCVPAQPGACALGVSVTDFIGDFENALTESDGNTLTITPNSNGEIVLYAEVLLNETMNIPATTVTISTTASPPATIRYVDVNLATGLNDGTSWENAFRDPLTCLKDGVDAAADNDWIWVADGTYYRPAGGTDPVLTMKDGVNIYGGFAGGELSLSQRGNPSAHPSILNGEYNSYSVVRGASNARLDGFTVKYGDSVGSGGGLYVKAKDNFVVENVRFEKNYAESYGGGMYVSDCSPTINKCVFYDNQAAMGVGLANDEAPDTTITNCSFIRNIGENYGAGMYNYRSPVTIINCTFNKNMSISYGGAMSNQWYSDVTIKNCVFWEDSAIWDDEIHLTSSTPVITFTDIQGGWAGTGNINTDPLFVGYPDVHLQYDSPCRDTATPEASILDDLDGNTRPSGFGYDMGAYEYQYVSANWYVDASASGAGTGESWDDAFTTVQDGMDAAAAGETVFVADGSYLRTLGGTSSVLTMKQGVDIYGGFTGVETYLEERGDPSANASVLDGEDMSYHVVLGASDAVLDGFAITRGNAANSVDPDNAGGGVISLAASNFTVSNCDIYNNYSLSGGAGMTASGSTFTVEGTSFHLNTTDSTGGALYSYNSTGAITGSDLSENAASTSGGALTTVDSGLTITNTVFGENDANTDFGGAIAIYTETSPTTIKNCLFHGNYSANYGGALYTGSATAPNITNCTFNLNTANYGGAISLFDATPVITDCILWGDSAAMSGNEIYIFVTGTPTVSYSVVQGGYTGTMNLNIDPQWVTGSLGDYYLSQTAAGQSQTSVCVNWGSDEAEDLGMDSRTTRTDDVADSDYVDLGYHYPLP